jgi:uncharacterized protein YfdQ (DUF2303 family)
MNNGAINQPVTNAEAAIDAGIGLAEIERRITNQHIGDVDVPVAIIPNGMSMRVLEDVLKIGDARAEKPRRLVGTAIHQELESFIAHAVRFKDENSVVFADVASVKLTAVFDYHQAAGAPRWGGHRSVYACPLSREWKVWTENNERTFTQEKFAQFLEDNQVDICSPDADSGEKSLFAAPAAMIEMARKLTLNLVGEFKREINPTTGESTLINKAEHGSGSTKIPVGFILGIPVFEAGEAYRLEARLRFSMPEGKPTFSYSLYQPDAVKRDAFGKVRADVAAGTQLPVFAGTPEV